MFGPYFFDKAGTQSGLLLVSSLILLLSIPGLCVHAEDEPPQHRELQTESEEKSGESSAQTEAVTAAVDLEAVIAAVTSADLAYVKSARERDQAAFRDLLDKDVIFLADEARKDIGDYDRTGEGARFFDPGPRRADAAQWKEP